ncbi:hypothetical protein HYPSUDRAFT_62986 [Hypholoma sublateritium FD-334 SS-4]|uniref:Mitochondrial escape protein 2 n=1 Tax=Hypholoma sublateritium (strain FD-334 SS-4) TaxID=945553 RepID=A0A0D2PFI7_HYPSF|nr:hypothetical protein HYPSUDRAFT_62986 [Hypholoma sublateritium FD-334 SS-4]
MLRLLSRRTYATAAASSTSEGWLYVNSVFPVQLGRWDFRHYIGILREEHLLSLLQTRLEQLSSVYDFKPLELEPQRKDGGVFVRFSYSPSLSETLPDGGDPLSTLQSALNEEASKHGVLPTWMGVGSGKLWVVRGSPWKEDMNRFASPILKVAFEGPDIQEQVLYELCRPYGRIRDVSPPMPAPVGSLRSSTITYQHLHSATIARNVIHGLQVPSPSEPAVAKTRLRAQYEKPLQAHAIRDWMSSHPKIMLPIIVFLLGTLTYTIFDPIRALMVESKMLDRFDYRKFKFYRWLQSNALHFSNDVSTKVRPIDDSSSPEVWKERKAAQAALHAYLADTPTTIAFVHGPQGSGKTTMLEAVIRDSARNALVIDCRELLNTSTDSALVVGLAAQTGYWPIFTFLNSMNNLIDIASVGIIGQKAGLSSSLPEQLKQILEAVTHALNGVSSSHRSTIQKQLKATEELKLRRVQAAHRQQAILEGTWHDGRLDCVAGNGIMSELGVGDELFDGEMTEHIKRYEESMQKNKDEQEYLSRRQKTLTEVEAITTLPVVVIRNYAANFGSTTKEDLLVVLAQWAAKLVENHIAHVIVLSDNRENAKRLTKALPSKPLNSIALSDADASSSLSFVKQKLLDSGSDIGISAQDAQHIERLGGRASDLESLIHKVRNGMKVDEAVEDIISRGVAELQKNAFGEDNEDGKNLPWSRYQAWKVLKMLATVPEVGYYDMLVDFPFKGDETALRSMEHAELISISTKNGRPATIRPGKPVLRWVFERVVNDKYFQATQELAYNEKQILDAEAKIDKYEQELALLVDTMKKERRPWYSFHRSPCVERARSVGEKLAIAERKVSLLERKNVGFKRLLSKEV